MGANTEAAMPDNAKPTSVASSEADQTFAQEQELRLLRARLAQREAALVGLNRRLRQLEQQRGGHTSDMSQSLVEAERRAEALEREVQAVYGTKTFRYTDSVRRLYGRTLLRRRSQ
jgi:hypothetical protein